MEPEGSLPHLQTLASQVKNQSKARALWNVS
jgi:hypothetical protein